MKTSEYLNGFLNGQRKLCQALLELKIENVADYQWLLAHLKEVSEGREYIDNTIIGFTKIP